MTDSCYACYVQRPPKGTSHGGRFFAQEPADTLPIVPLVLSNHTSKKKEKHALTDYDIVKKIVCAADEHFWDEIHSWCLDCGAEIHIGNHCEICGEEDFAVASVCVPCEANREALGLKLPVSHRWLL